MTKARKEELIRLVYDKGISVDELKMLVNELGSNENKNSLEDSKTSSFKFWE